MTTKHDFSKEEKLIDLCIEYGIDLTNRVINFTGDLEEGYFQLFDFAMTYMEKVSGKGITIKINTEGGDVYESMALVARIRESKCQIITKAYGKCMSSGFLLLAAGDKRLASRWVTIMHHGVSYNMALDKHKHNKDYLVQVEREERMRFLLLEELTSMDFIYWKESAQYKDTYYSPEECLQMGVIDEIF